MYCIQNPFTAKGFTSRGNLLIMVVAGIFLALAVQLLPKGFSDDLSVIGKGTVVVALTHDKNSVGSLELMTLLHMVREEYHGRVDFLAIDVTSGEGQTFIKQQGLTGISLVLFDAKGVRRGTLNDSTTENALRIALDNALAER